MSAGAAVEVAGCAPLSQRVCSSTTSCEEVIITNLTPRRCNTSHARSASLTVRIVMRRLPTGQLDGTLVGFDGSGKRQDNCAARKARRWMTPRVDGTHTPVKRRSRAFWTSEAVQLASMGAIARGRRSGRAAGLRNATA